jgi:hypothetical protein
MSKVLLRLSVEELAMAFIQVGKPKMAEDLIAARYGSLGKEDYAIRLVTIRNSMMARGWMKDEVLDAKVAKTIELLANAKYTLWCSHNTVKKVENISFHFCDGMILENRLEQDVIHKITLLEDEEAVYKNAAAFFEMNKARNFSAQSALIPNTVLSEFLNAKENVPIIDRLNDPDFSMIQTLRPAEKIKQMRDPNIDKEMPKNTRKLFAEDWETSRSWGLIMRLDTSDGKPQFDKGFIILRGFKRFWLMRPKMKGEESAMEAFPGTKKTFYAELKALI